MKLTLSTQLLLRTPAIPTNQTLAESFEELKAKIAESSPTFHALIKDLHPSDIPNQPEKIQFTIWKYFNRARYRATPFGTFAAITLLPLNFQTNPTILQSKLITHRWTNWKQTTNYSKHTLTKDTQLLTNSTIYMVENQIRYLHQQNEKFELATIEATPAINTILQTCKTKTSTQDLYQLLQQNHKLTKPSINSIITQLISLQLFHSDQQTNITGTDYFQRLNLSSPPSPSDYIICERKPQSGSFDGRSLKHLPAYINFLSTHIQPEPPEALTTFIQAFNQRYEGRQIPLTQLMDPEIGLGYGKSEQTPATTQATNYHTNPANHTNPTQTTNPDYPTQQDQPNQAPTYPNTKLHQWLLQKLIGGGEIDLSEFQLDQPNKTSQTTRAQFANQTKQTHAKSGPLPNTLSAVFHRYKDHIVLSELGGATATSLLGRFTPCSKEIESYAKDLANIEQQANPDVIFFDIAYINETAVDNINRRKQLYPYELPLLCWSEAAHPLTLTDILVTVHGGQVILLSKTLNKRIIPRIPSAYNYLRSHLPVYRFLCDIQSQNLSVNFNFNLQDRFPGLSRYPRVSYQNIMVSPASWLIPSDQLQSPATLATWLSQQKLTNILKAGSSDQYLYFDPNKKQDIFALWQYWKQQKNEVYLSEALLSAESMVVDRQANNYPAQYIASLFHNEQIYEGCSVQAQHTQTQFLPGSEWLYAKIYCHPQSTGMLLLELIQKLVEDHKRLLKKWFFIRYHDPKPHIRLRLQLKNTADVPVLICALHHAFSKPMQTGIISEFSLHSYEPELDRYGASRMEMVEEFFALDSSYALQVIKSSGNIPTLQSIAIETMSTLISFTLPNPSLQHRFAKGMFENFAREFELSAAQFKQFNADFRLFSQDKEKVHRPISPGLKLKWKSAFQQVIKTCENQTIAEKMLADLIHMHINRLSTTQQRWNEMILYHYLQRISASQCKSSK